MLFCLLGFLSSRIISYYDCIVQIGFCILSVLGKQAALWSADAVGGKKSSVLESNVMEQLVHTEKLGHSLFYYSLIVRKLPNSYCVNFPIC